VLDTAANTEVNPVDVPDIDVLFKFNIVLSLFYYEVLLYRLSTTF
jgi:hypothetical protein